jgi:aminoglycoside phosphotransferase (APT) family kinase protein
VAIGDLSADRLIDRIRRHIGRATRVIALETLPGGLSGITYVVHLTGPSAPDRLVVKVAPAGLPPTKNRDVLRQARILGHLSENRAIPVPSVLFIDAGRPPDEPPLYATEFIDGDNIEPLNDLDPVLPDPESLRRRYVHAAQILGRLHQVRDSGPMFDGVGIDTPADELAKWSQVFRAVPDDLRVGADACETLLGRDVPGPGSTTLVHGDFRLGNTICKHDQIQAVIDWELWGRGDPRSDLAWFLSLSDPNSPVSRRQPEGVPTRTEMLDEYAGTGGPAVAEMAWFDALALYKRAAALALIVKHTRRAPQPDPHKAEAVHVIRPLLDTVARILS